jgi:hypothetical protein
VSVFGELSSKGRTGILSMVISGEKKTRKRKEKECKIKL